VEFSPNAACCDEIDAVCRSVPHGTGIVGVNATKAAFHDTDTDILATILADSPDPREGVGVGGVDVGVVECGLNHAALVL